MDAFLKVLKNDWLLPYISTSGVEGLKLLRL